MVRRRTEPLFQRGVNPYSGENQRGFRAGGYDHAAVKQNVEDSLRRVLGPAGLTLDMMDFWIDPQFSYDPIVRLKITPDEGEQETHDVRVHDEGFTPWAGTVGPTLVAWVTEHYSLE